MFSDTNKQLRKLSIYKPMQFRVTEIEFDFTDDIGDGDTMDDFLTDEYKQEQKDHPSGWNLRGVEGVCFSCS
jgi:hypothetical protein